MVEASTGQQPGGAAGIQSDSRQAADGGFTVDGNDAPDKQRSNATESPEDEELLVERLWKEYDAARKFDENFRKQVAIDRRYAAGTSDLSWAVTTNLIGAFIDILQAILYARNPDVSVRKTRQVDNSNTGQMDSFATTLELVISSLWLRGNLKRAARKSVRSTLSNAEGWLKCTMVSEKVPRPEVETALNDAQETLARLRAQKEMLEDPESGSPDEIDALIAEKEALTAELEEKLELAVNKMFVIDFVRTEDFQCSMDVASVCDHLDADWNSNELYLEKDDALARFERLTPDDLREAKFYYQRAPKEMTTRDIDNVLPQGQLTAETAQAFVTAANDQTATDKQFVRVVEIWDRRDKQIRTIIDGCKRWAKEPYPPPYPTSRFYPYFGLVFFEVDGARHAQSLSWRLYKLQDEYSSVRSNFRLTRQRAIPATLFNATGLDDGEAKKLVDAKEQEYVAIRPSDPQTPLANLFAPKPVSPIDPRLYDPTYILNDMERVSGVQEALQSAIASTGNPITATEANIQQSGTAARTNADRDSLEMMLTDLAVYTAQQALQCLTIKDAQRIAGPKAFWPAGMSIEDLFTMVEIEITAGSTGKPKAPTDQQAWATLLPLIREIIVQIEQELARGNIPMVSALTELIKETMVRMGDESDPDRFIPHQPPPGTPGAGTPPPPIRPNVNISLKGMLDPATSAQLAAPDLITDQMAAPRPPVAPGAPAGPIGPNGPGPVLGGAPGASPAPPGGPAPMPNMPIPGPGQTAPVR